MVDIQRKSALQQAADQAPSISVNGLVITERRPEIIVQINGATEPSALQLALSSTGFTAGQFAAGRFNAGRAYRREHATALWNGPGMWMLVCENSSRNSELSGFVDELNTVLRDTDATVTDLSHSRTCLAMQGENLLDFLYTGCPIDLNNCEPDACFSTQFGHFNIMLHLQDRQHANMYVYRSFGQALWDHCQHIVVTLPPNVARRQ
ncbi:sarcosine oxidase subunit gamma [Candidatus Spongiihabitans sp.]|uniref:sarcosine oxidase subunit gamma n=1 Tax=Candidatus Spongiihabitans sp. TaxID=3101308 RepID=UPI003C7BC23B